jgi:hypothetical protein
MIKTFEYLEQEALEVSGKIHDLFDELFDISGTEDEEDSAHIRLLDLKNELFRIGLEMGYKAFDTPLTTDEILDKVGINRKY